MGPLLALLPRWETPHVMVSSPLFVCEIVGSSVEGMEARGAPILSKGQQSRTACDPEDNVPFAFEYNCFGPFRSSWKGHGKTSEWRPEIEWHLSRHLSSLTLKVTEICAWAPKGCISQEIHAGALGSHEGSKWEAGGVRPWRCLNKTSSRLLGFIFSSEFTPVGHLLSLTSIYFKSQIGVTSHPPHFQTTLK